MVSVCKLQLVCTALSLVYTEHNNDGPDHSMYGASNHLAVMLGKHHQALQHATMEPSMLQECSGKQVRHTYESSACKTHHETNCVYQGVVVNLYWHTCCFLTARQSGGMLALTCILITGMCR